jgi:hypothetical protein
VKSTSIYSPLQSFAMKLAGGWWQAVSLGDLFMAPYGATDPVAISEANGLRAETADKRRIQNSLAAFTSSAFNQSTPFSNKTFHTLFRALTGHPGVSQKRAWMPSACASSMSFFSLRQLVIRDRPKPVPPHGNREVGARNGR